MSRHAQFFNNIDKILDQREEVYGTPHKFFENLALRWQKVLGQEITHKQVVLCMIELKMERLIASPEHSDSIVDIIGYATLLHEDLQENC